VRDRVAVDAIAALLGPQSLSACYRTWKARGRPASRRTSSTVDVLALRHPLQWDGGDGGAMANEEAAARTWTITSRLGSTVFATEYNSWTAGVSKFSSEESKVGGPGQAHRRPAPSNFYEAAHEYLTSELVKCLLFIMNDEDDPKLSAIDNQRRRYARILWAIAKIGYDNKLPQLGIYIASLGVALEDLIRGVTDPLFVTKGSKRKGSKRDSMLKWGARLQAALGVECLILSGLTREKTASTAARDYNELARLLRGKNRDLKGSLLSWYDLFIEELVPVPELLEAFQTERRELKAVNLSPAEYLRRGEQAFAQAVKSAIR
jgi:hypothetical protein